MLPEQKDTALIWGIKEADLINKQCRSSSRIGYQMLIALTALAISVLNASLTCCICGHIGFISLPGSIIGASASWYIFATRKKTGLLRRVVIYIACIVTTLLLFKNGCDILWLGHDPLLL